MVKCDPCAQSLCKGKYENRQTCKNPGICSCSCQEDPNTTFWKTAGSIGFGVAAFTGGVILAVSTGGLGLVGMAAAAAGGALTGVGTTAAIHPIAKNMSGERMTGGEYAKDLFIGGTVGAITGPIGAGGASATTSIASKVGTEAMKQGAVKLGCRTAVGAVVGATGSVIGEGINAAATDDATFSIKNVFKGAAVGAATGGAGHVTRNVSSVVANQGVVKGAVKVAGDTISTVVIDGTAQYVTEGEIEHKRLLLRAATKAATSTGQKVVTKATEQTLQMFGDKEIKNTLSTYQINLLGPKNYPETANSAKVDAQKDLEKPSEPDTAKKGAQNKSKDGTHPGSAFGCNKTDDDEDV